MALQLSKILSSGVTANYWRVSEVSLSIGQAADITVGLYLSDAARAAGREPIQKVRYYWLPNEFSTSLGSSTLNQIIGDIYNRLKTLPEYSGSQDV